MLVQTESEGKKWPLTTQFLFAALKKDVELERPFKVLLDSEEIATGVHLVRKLENEGRVRVSLLSVGVRLDDILGVSNHGVLDMVCGKELACDLSGGAMQAYLWLSISPLAEPAVQEDETSQSCGGMRLRIGHL